MIIEPMPASPGCPPPARTASRLSPSEFSRIKHAWHCTGMNCNGLSVLLADAIMINVPERAILFGPGSNTQALHFVLDGVVGLMMSDGRGAETLVAIAAPGNFVGEPRVLASDNGQLSARTLAPATLVEIPMATVRRALDGNPCFRRFFFGILSEGLRRLVRQYTELKLMTAQQRLGAFLLGLTKGQEGPVRVPLAFNRQVLAEMLGMRPETVTRAFGKLSAVGVGRPESDVITIEDVECLKRFCKTTLDPTDDFDRREDEHPQICMGQKRLDDQDSVPDVALFAMLSDVDVHAVLSEAQYINYETPALLFQAGTLADRCFVVVSGRVRLFITNDDGREAVIDYVGSGQSFAEAALFGSGRYPVSAEALPNTRLLHIPKSSLSGRLSAEALFAMPLLEAITKRQRQLFKQIMEYKTHTPTQRLVFELLRMTEVSSGSATITLNLSKSALAGRLGLTPESLSRAFVRLRALGVETHRTSEIHIADIVALRLFCTQGSQP